MSVQFSLTLAVLIVLVIIVIVYFLGRPGARRDGFMPGDPATPKLRGAVFQIQNSLGCLVALNGKVCADEPGEKSSVAAAARSGIALIAAGVAPLYEKISHMTPTYQNVLSVYQGLCDSGKQFRANADAFYDASQKLSGETATAGCALGLKTAARCCYDLIRSIHYLGACLGLE